MEKLTAFLEEEKENFNQELKRVDIQPYAELFDWNEVHDQRLTNTLLDIVEEEIEKKDRYELGGYVEEGFCMEMDEEGTYVEYKDIKQILTNLKKNN